MAGVAAVDSTDPNPRGGNSPGTSCTLWSRVTRAPLKPTAGDVAAHAGVAAAQDGTS